MPAHMPSLEHCHLPAEPVPGPWEPAGVLFWQGCRHPALSWTSSVRRAVRTPSHWPAFDCYSCPPPSVDTSGPPREQGPVGLGDQPHSHLNVRPTPESLGGHVVLAGPSQALSRGCVPGKAGPCGHPTTGLLLYLSPGTLLWSLILPGQGRGSPTAPETHQRGEHTPPTGTKLSPGVVRVPPWDSWRTACFLR